jgi:flagellar protein FlaF
MQTVTALYMARTAYATPGTPARSPRRIEYDLFAQVTQRLKAAQSADNFANLTAALYDNEKMWLVLATDVAEPGNGLPESLRARLFYLYEFTAQHSRKVREGTASAEVLIDINTAIMRGLRGEGIGT